MIRYLVPLVLILISIVFAVFLYEDAKNKNNVLKSKGDIHRLTMVTLEISLQQNVRDKNFNFWKTIEKQSPMLDAWGNEYKLSFLNDSLIWRSAGIDGIYGSSDDILLSTNLSVAQEIQNAKLRDELVEESNAMEAK